MNQKTKKIVRIILAIVASLTFIIALFVVSMIFVIDSFLRTDEDRAFETSFESIQLGQDQSEVLNSLGKPHDSGKKFYLSQEAGYQADYEAAASSASVRYCFWRREVDLTYAIGLDKYGRVCFKARGRT